VSTGHYFESQGGPRRIKPRPSTPPKSCRTL